MSNRKQRRHVRIVFELGNGINWKRSLGRSCGGREQSTFFLGRKDQRNECIVCQQVLFDRRRLAIEVLGKIETYGAVST